MTAGNSALMRAEGEMNAIVAPGSRALGFIADGIFELGR